MKNTLSTLSAPKINMENVRAVSTVTNLSSHNMEGALEQLQLHYCALQSEKCELVATIAAQNKQLAQAQHSLSLLHSALADAVTSERINEQRIESQAGTIVFMRERHNKLREVVQKQKERIVNYSINCDRMEARALRAEANYELHMGTHRRAAVRELEFDDIQ